ncbi:MAG: Crp/Fnr family transcriptional regulator [Gammaproteobacteria bacterium]|nr:Crp/Fnr family transcriptional regulator [Gammaproteobacteria bacterium]MDH5653741.1 Crp/Fnr family transcriptional regulator [Gammaproteobacteria bacterium]
MMMPISLQAEEHTLSPVYRLFQERLKHRFPELAADENPDWHALIGAANVVELPAGTDILQPHTLCEQFILLLNGTVRIYQQTAEDREVTLYRIEAGKLCVLSINGLLHRKTFGAFAKAETHVQALILSRPQFMQAMAISAAFREYVLTDLTDRYHDMLELMEDTIFESLDTRLICMLGRLSRGSNSDTIHITHQELARELGTSREVISRLLKTLERKGCISLGRGVIHMAV